MNQAWLCHEKPREKLLNKGAHSLSDAELLAIFLRTGTKGCNVMQLSLQLLNQFGSLQQLFSASFEEFSQHHGLGLAKFVQLQASLEMSKRYLQEQLQLSDGLASSSQTKQYLVSELKAETREVFAVLWLNNQHQVINFERLFYGSIASAQVHPRVVVEQALKHKAAAVILSHNHPSGVNEPSIADKQITEQLTQALSLIEVRVLDHIIIAGSQQYSFAEHGLI